MSRDRDTFDMFKPRSRARFGDDELRGEPERVTRSKLCDLDLVLHYETHPSEPDKGAVFVSDNGDEKRAKWVPKSLCQINPGGKRPARGVNARGQAVSLKLVSLTMDEWVAKDKGLI